MEFCLGKTLFDTLHDGGNPLQLVKMEWTHDDEMSTGKVP